MYKEHDRTAEDARKAMAEWVAAIADKIKNPIAGVMAALDIFDREFERYRALGTCDEKIVTTSLTMVRRRLASLNVYVSELADFAKPASVRIAKTPVKTLLDHFQRILEIPSHPDVTIETQVGPYVKNIYCDSPKLSTMLAALVANGIEAVSTEVKPHIIVSFAPHSAKGEHRSGVTITVEDNGSGIPDDIKDNVLKPFFTTKEAGTGLGLSLVRKYTEAHGGHFAIGRSATLGGCEIRIFIPDQLET